MSGPPPRDACKLALVLLDDQSEDDRVNRASLTLGFLHPTSPVSDQLLHLLSFKIKIAISLWHDASPSAEG